MTDFFIRGLLNFLQFPAQIMVLVGLGLLLGQQGVRHVRMGWLAFVLAIVAGLLLTRLLVAWNANLLLLILAVGAGCLLALRLQLPVWLCALLLAATGLLLGLDSFPPIIPGMKTQKIYAIMAGTAVADSLAVLLAGLLGWSLRNLLDGVVLRVLGSWVAASALMVLALTFAPR